MITAKPIWGHVARLPSNVVAAVSLELRCDSPTSFPPHYAVPQYPAQYPPQCPAQYPPQCPAQYPAQYGLPPWGAVSNEPRPYPTVARYPISQQYPPQCPAQYPANVAPSGQHEQAQGMQQSGARAGTGYAALILGVPPTCAAPTCVLEPCPNFTHVPRGHLRDAVCTHLGCGVQSVGDANKRRVSAAVMQVCRLSIGCIGCVSDLCTLALLIV